MASSVAEAEVRGTTSTTSSVAGLRWWRSWPPAGSRRSRRAHGGAPGGDGGVGGVRTAGWAAAGVVAGRVVSAWKGGGRRRPPGATARRGRSGGRSRPGRLDDAVVGPPDGLDAPAQPGDGLRVAGTLTSSPRTAATGRLGASRTGVLPRTPPPGWWPVWPMVAGACWSSVPPSATLSTCVPRQMASSGRSRSSAPRARATSRRRASAGPVGWRPGAVAGRSSTSYSSRSAPGRRRCRARATAGLGMLASSSGRRPLQPNNIRSWGTGAAQHRSLPAPATAAT